MISRGGSMLGGELLQSIQRGTMSYTYKGIPTLKNPFDWALYPLLLWEIQPRTVIEIGSNHGGSAVWFADMLRTFDCGGHVHSIDLTPPNLVAAGVTFHEGDAEHLDRTLSAAFMEALPRPL